MELVKWSCPRAGDMALRIWSDGAVVFDEANGDLHSLTSTAAEVLSLLIKQTYGSTVSLAQDLLGELPTASDVEMMENMLMHFESLNIIQRRPV